MGLSAIFLLWITCKIEKPSVCTPLSLVPSVLIAAESHAGLGEEQSPKDQLLLPEFCSSWGFAFIAPWLFRHRSWALRALAIASDFAFLKETLGGFLRCDLVSPMRQKQWKRMVQKLKKCLFLNWFLSKEVKKEGNLNSCWKESSVIYFCNPYFPRFGQYLYISLLSCIFGTKILVVVCIITWFSSVAACKKAEVIPILKMQLILKHCANF